MNFLQWMLRCHPPNAMDSGFLSLLKVAAYLVIGTAGIVPLAGWVLKWFGPQK